MASTETTGEASAVNPKSTDDRQVGEQLVKDVLAYIDVLPGQHQHRGRAARGNSEHGMGAVDPHVHAEITLDVQDHMQRAKERRRKEGLQGKDMGREGDMGYHEAMQTPLLDVERHAVGDDSFAVREDERCT